MNRREFMQRLEQALQSMPAEERRRAVEYYEDYFEEAGPDKEAEVLQDLGAPEKVAADILREFRDVTPNGQTRFGENKKRTQSFGEYFSSLDKGQKTVLTVLLIVAAICILPASIGVIGGLGGLLIGIVCVIGGVFLIVPALAVGAWGCLVAFVVQAVMAALQGEIAALVLMIGLACISLAFAILLMRATVYLFKTVFVGIIRAIIDFFNRLVHPRR